VCSVNGRSKFCFLPSRGVPKRLILSGSGPNPICQRTMTLRRTSETDSGGSIPNFGRALRLSREHISNNQVVVSFVCPFERAVCPELARATVA